ncbi:MAG: glycosyltransferase family 4 protein [Chloroflexi bacterium]|nr:glycosyltransferase family 4 protein [Chloroflexota bacterium]
MAKRRVDQLLVGAAPGDAIFNEALFLRGILRERGYASEIYAERISPALPRGDAHTADGYRARADDVLIFHYSIGSTLNALVRLRAPRLLFIYHNITPPEYFRGVNPQIADGAEHGRAELPTFKEQSELALADSEFNRLELEGLGYPRTAVLPLAETLSQRATPDPQIMHAMQDGSTNVLFVGRVAPNKKQDDLLRFLYAFRQIDPRARLVLVGAWGGCERYLASLRSLAAALGLSAQVVLAGHVEDAALVAYYRSAHLFLCLSEHEGFCVPLVEAMALGVPVAAYASTGVPYTLGNAGVLVHAKRWDVLAALASALTRDESLRARIIAGQSARARDFSPPAVQAQFEAQLTSIGL